MKNSIKSIIDNNINGAHCKETMMVKVREAVIAFCRTYSQDVLVKVSSKGQFVAIAVYMYAPAGDECVIGNIQCYIFRYDYVDGTWSYNV